MIKVVELIKRRSGLSVEDFQSRWRNRHAALVASVPGLARYVQSHPLIQGYRKAELLYDGLSEMWFATEAARDQFCTSDEYRRAKEDLNDFTDIDRTVSFPVDVHVIKDGPIPPKAVKNVEFVTRRPGMALEPFRDYWRNVHGPIAAKIPVIQRYEQNHTSLSAYEADTPPAYEGLAITWFHSTDDMKRGATTPEYAEARADEPYFLPDGHLPIIITREHFILA